MARATHFILSGANNSSKTGFTTTDQYDSIGPDVGISKLAANDRVDTSNDVSNLIKQGLMIRLRVRYQEGNEHKTAFILCSISKVSSAITGIRGKAFKGGTITSASIMRRRRRGVA
jgi:hypothetical protein